MLYEAQNFDQLKLKLDFYEKVKKSKAASKSITTYKDQCKPGTEKFQQQSGINGSRKPGDVVMISNTDMTPGISKKLIPKYRGP